MSPARLVLALLAACGGGSSSHVTPEPSAGSSGALAPPPAREDLVDCAALDGPALATASLGSDWSTSQRTLAKRAGGATIGVFADAGSAAPATLAALGRLRAQLDAAHVDVVVAVDGVAATAAEIQTAVAALATNAAWPIVVLPGDVEPAAEHDAAMVALQQQHLPVVDGKLARWIELPGITIGTLPGAGAASRHASGPAGCGYRGDERDAIVAALAQKPGLRVLAAVEAPRSSADGDPTGDLELPNATIDLVIHAEADAATPDTTGTRGGALISLTPGVADASPRLRAPRPSAGILSVRDNNWTWRLLDMTK